MALMYHAVHIQVFISIPYECYINITYSMSVKCNYTPNNEYIYRISMQGCCFMQINLCSWQTAIVFQLRARRCQNKVAVYARVIENFPLNISNISCYLLTT